MASKPTSKKHAPRIAPITPEEDRATNWLQCNVAPFSPTRNT